MISRSSKCHEGCNAECSGSLCAVIEGGSVSHGTRRGEFCSKPERCRSITDWALLRSIAGTDSASLQRAQVRITVQSTLQCGSWRCETRTCTLAFPARKYSTPEWMLL
jgi:hypothetical protein